VNVGGCIRGDVCPVSLWSELQGYDISRFRVMLGTRFDVTDGQVAASPSVRKGIRVYPGKTLYAGSVFVKGVVIAN
jgi:nitrite reductase/ring-hydroxylating ferredoxin subunit